MSKIMLCDDSAFMRSILKNILIKQNHEIVAEAKNGLEAIRFYKWRHPEIVTMDVTMDIINGIEATAEIIKYDRAAKIIMVSSMGQQGVIIDALAAGAKGFIVKPFQEHQVINEIDAVLKARKNKE